MIYLKKVNENPSLELGFFILEGSCIEKYLHGINKTPKCKSVKHKKIIALKFGIGRDFCYIFY
jgi:hypothetical protein